MKKEIIARFESSTDHQDDQRRHNLWDAIELVKRLTGLEIEQCMETFSNPAKGFVLVVNTSDKVKYPTAEKIAHEIKARREKKNNDGRQE